MAYYRSVMSTINVTAQVVLCLVCGVPTDGVWGLPAPVGCRAEPYCFFPAWHHERDAMPVLPIPNPMDEVRGGIFIRFAEVLVRCLCFHFSTYVVHAVSGNHFKLGTWAVTKFLRKRLDGSSESNT